MWREPASSRVDDRQGRLSHYSSSDQQTGGCSIILIEACDPERRALLSGGTSNDAIYRMIAAVLNRTTGGAG